MLDQSTSEIDGRFDQLASRLNLPLARVAGLVDSCPGLVLEPAESVGERLEAIREMLGGVSSGLVAELVAKEPRVSV